MLLDKSLEELNEAFSESLFQIMAVPLEKLNDFFVSLCKLSVELKTLAGSWLKIRTHFIVCQEILENYN